MTGKTAQEMSPMSMTMRRKCKQGNRRETITEQYRHRQKESKKERQNVRQKDEKEKARRKDSKR